MAVPRIMFEQTEVLDSVSVAAALKARLERAGSPAQMLSQEAARRGYRSRTGAKAELGIRQKYRADTMVKPPKGVSGPAIQEVEFELLVRSFARAGSKDEAAVATVTITAGANRDTYEMLLEAPGGNFSKGRESIVVGGQVIPAKSWWTATKSCLRNKCASVCVGALVTCGGTWAAYLGCVAAACGGCWVRCAACASCNCHWWCKWAAGCCHR
jgi:hypothetical protein